MMRSKRELRWSWDEFFVGRTCRIGIFEGNVTTRQKDFALGLECGSPGMRIAVFHIKDAYGKRHMVLPHS